MCTADSSVALLSTFANSGHEFKSTRAPAVDAGMAIRSAVCAPPALQNLSDAFPDLIIYAGGIDPELDENGYIVPGLGDAGDRSFGTL